MARVTEGELQYYALLVNVITFLFGRKTRGGGVLSVFYYRLMVCG